jgi:polysaccharide deacetylase 2 family uncharacterized protein YibQ
MGGESLIRLACRFVLKLAPDAAFGLLLGAGLWLGGVPALAGLPQFLDALLPGMAAQASPETGMHVARFALAGFEPSRYAPQVLYPVTGSGFPKWLTEAVRASHLTPPPALRGVPVAAQPGRPVIAICMDDLGEDLAGTDRAMALPRQVALSFLPYAEATPFLAEAAAKKGHLVLAHVPMQALGGGNPGAMALMTGMDAPEITRRLAWNLSRVPGLAGINNHEGSRFTADAAGLAPVMAMLKARGLFFLDSRTSGGSLGERVARSAGVESASRDIFLDDDPAPAAVRAQLQALAAEARRSGAAIAIGHPHDATLRALAAWLRQDHGVTLVPLDEAMRIKRERAVRVAAARG